MLEEKSSRSGKRNCTKSCAWGSFVRHEQVVEQKARERSIESCFYLMRDEKKRCFIERTLNDLYVRYHHAEFIHPDPLEFVHRYENPSDRELVALIASSLAYGRVRQILKSVGGVLDRLGPSPSDFLLSNKSADVLEAMFSDFKHRFTEGRHLTALLLGARKVILRYGSLHKCFLSKCRPQDENIIETLSAFVEELSAESPSDVGMLLPSPRKGSACKRLNLFLRWMVRCDEIDPGGWQGVNPAQLVIPLDTHMHRFSLSIGLTNRKQADLKTALEITQSFRLFSPEDPVRYDFALTRPGIRDSMNWRPLLSRTSLENEGVME